jgi:uroporphyrinogen III methyltransferase/synthase
VSDGRKRRRKTLGTAYLVGAGPGDPDLITLRGHELLGQADAIVFDALANPELLRAAREHNRARVELHDVGKRGGEAETSARQESINELLIRLVRQGKRVVRLKGGDPLVFGRGGEEAQALADAGLPFEIVPGVTAGIAAPAYAGIPVTHRGMSTSVTFVTGHEDPMKGAPQTDWGALARAGGTIVLYMGMRKLPGIVASLMSAGMQGEMPAAVIEWGTMNRQRTVVATLETIVDHAEREGIGAPAITVIGWTVVLRDDLAWFDRRPLFGQRILVTRAGESPGVSGLGAKLREWGADVVEIASTRIVPTEQVALRDRLQRLTEYSWVIFTSANAVNYFWDGLSRIGLDARSLAPLRICAVGPATAATLATRGIVADVQPRRFAAEGVLDALRERADIAGANILYPCAEGARPTLQNGLVQLGARVDRVHLYRSEADDSNVALLRTEMEKGDIALAAFTSASAVRAFAVAVGPALLSHVRAASIGPVTSDALREAGIDVNIEAEEATLDGLVRAILMASASGDDVAGLDSPSGESDEDDSSVMGDDA